MEAAKKYLIVVVGPTAVGKTSFCVRLARHFGTQIVNADSRQIYREMSIGTAKPTVAEQQGVPHHLIDFQSVSDPYTAGMFERDALRKIEEIHGKKHLAILSGGTGLYVKAVCEGLDDIPSSPEVRAQLNALFAAQGIAPLLDKLATQDPVYYQTVDRANPKRLIRALEAIAVTNKPYSTLRKAAQHPRPFGIIKIGLARERPELYARIDQRVEQMLAAGLVAEAEALYPQRQLAALQTVGYQELFDFWEGHLASAEEAIGLIKRNSRRYAKRQLTWFRRDTETKWFHPDDSALAIQFIEQQLTVI
jgi:tRNA dimethylallyltransferase